VIDTRARELAAMPYEEYLRTPEWQERRQAALQRAGHRCQVCNSPHQLEVHHRTYDRRGHEDDADLTVLCERHHEMFHGIGSAAGRRGEIGSVRHLPDATLWTFTPAPVDPVRRRRVLARAARRAARERLGAIGLVVRIGLALVGIGVLAVLILSHA
jgi:hypothetical protein